MICGGDRISPNSGNTTETPATVSGFNDRSRSRKHR